MPLRVSLPIAPGIQYSTGAGGGRRGPGGGKARLIGGLVVLALLALLLLVVLIVGGLVLITFGVYVGVLARRGPAPSVAESPTVPIPVQGWSRPPTPLVAVRPVRMPFGLEPSYGLSVACIVIGFLMFVVGLVLLPLPKETETPPAISSGVAAAPVVPSFTPHSRQPVVTHPDPPPSPTYAPPAQTTTRPEPVETREEPVKTREKPKERPKPAASQGTAEDNDNANGGAAFYKNCAAAKSAGAAPLRKGEPGYRAQLDRDKDGVACE